MYVLSVAQMCHVMNCVVFRYCGAASSSPGQHQQAFCQHSEAQRQRRLYAIPGMSTRGRHLSTHFPIINSKTFKFYIYLQMSPLEFFWVGRSPQVETRTLIGLLTFPSALRILWVLSKSNPILKPLSDCQSSPTLLFLCCYAKSSDWFFLTIVKCARHRGIVLKMFFATLLQDLCQLVNADAPYWLVGMTEMTRTFGLELLESVLNDFPGVFLQVCSTSYM